MVVNCHLAVDVKTIQIKTGNGFPHTNSTGKHKQDNIYLPKYSISFSESSSDRICGKIMFCSIV